METTSYRKNEIKLDKIHASNTETNVTLHQTANLFRLTKTSSHYIYFFYREKYSDTP